MARSQADHVSDTGSTIFTRDAPIMKYLEQLKDQWDDAGYLLSLLDSHIGFLGDSLGLYDREKYFTDAIVVELLDIHLHKSIKTWRALKGSDLIETDGRRSKINHLTQGFHECHSDVHTRIVLLTLSPPEVPTRHEAEILILAHILGIELDMIPAELGTFLLEASGSKSWLPARGREYFRPPNNPRRLHFRHDKRTHTSCYHLGMRDVNGCQVDHVMVCLSRNWLQAYRPPSLSGGRSNDDASLGPIYDLREPPKASELLGGHCSSHQQISPAKAQEPEIAFYHLCSRVLKTRTWNTALLEKRVPRLHWLCAVMWMLKLQSLYALTDLNHLKEVVLAGSLDQESHNRSKTSDHAIAVQVDLEAGLHQIEAFCQDHPAPPRGDIEPELRQLKSILHQVSAVANSIRSYEERLMARKTERASDLTIRESRSAIALTILAVVFVPISLASSIFGMNVREINNTGHSIWTFVVTAVLMLATSGLAWTLWRMVRNITLLHRHTRKTIRSPPPSGLSPARWIESLDDMQMAFSGLEKSWWQRIKCWLGLRAIEKSGVSGV